MNNEDTKKRWYIRNPNKKNVINKLNLQKQFQDFQYKPAILEYWVYERMDTEIYRGHLQFMCKCHTHSRRLIKEAAEVKGWPLKCTVLSKNTNSWSYFKKIVLWMNFFSVIYLIIVFVKVFINLGQIIITFTWCAGFVYLNVLFGGKPFLGNFLSFNFITL